MEPEWNREAIHDLDWNQCDLTQAQRGLELGYHNLEFVRCNLALLPMGPRRWLQGHQRLAHAPTRHRSNLQA